mmetsp:Transcript_45752/g.147320  ORF Transcript_45752/g.147320 Transcript_45752/m.147320 type:complete len:251 (-) Transcript_45752:150-902(-)
MSCSHTLRAEAVPRPESHSFSMTRRVWRPAQCPLLPLRPRRIRHLRLRHLRLRRHLHRRCPRHRLRHRLWLALVFGLARIDGRLQLAERLLQQLAVGGRRALAEHALAKERDLLLEQARAARRLAGRELLDPHVRRLLLLGTKGRRRGAQLRRRLLNGGGAEDEFELLVLGRVAPNLYRGAERLNRLGKRLAAAALVVQLALLKESQLHLHQPGGARVAGRDRLLNPCLRLLALGDAEALGRERDLLRSR